MELGTKKYPEEVAAIRYSVNIGMFVYRKDYLGTAGAKVPET